MASSVSTWIQQEQPRYKAELDFQKEGLAAGCGFATWSHDFLPQWSMELAQDLTGWIAAPLQDFFQELVDATEDVVLQSHTSCCGARKAILQIAEDAVGVKDERQLVAPLVMMMTISVNYSLPGVILSGLTLTTKATYALVSMGMVAGAYKMWIRWPELADRTVQRRASVVLLITSAYHGILALMGTPVMLGAYVAHPDIVVHGFLDLIVQPLLILNLGHLTGRMSKQMLPAICLASVGTTACTLAAASHVFGRSILLLGVGAWSFSKAHAEISEELSDNPSYVSSTNKARMQIGTDLLAFCWITFPVVEAVGLYGGVSPERFLFVMEIIDVLQKLGVCHLVLKNEAALKLSSAFMQSRPCPSEATPVRSSP